MIYYVEFTGLHPVIVFNVIKLLILLAVKDFVLKCQRVQTSRDLTGGILVHSTTFTFLNATNGLLFGVFNLIICSIGIGRDTKM